MRQTTSFSLSHIINEEFFKPSPSNTEQFQDLKLGKCIQISPYTVPIMCINECNLSSKCDASSKTSELKQIPGVWKKPQQLTKEKKKKRNPVRTTNEDFKYKVSENAISCSELFLHAYCTLIEHTQNFFPSNQQV